MTLNGHKRKIGKRSGGIRSISLIAAEDFKSADYLAESNSYKAVTTKDGAAFSTYQFKEDEAAFTETALYDNGSYLVAHQLTFMLERIDSDTSSVIEELAESSPGGIVAVITTNNDISFLVGYSDKFGTERSLRLKKSVGTSGQKLSDMTAETITLYSEDTAKAKIFTGQISA